MSPGKLMGFAFLSYLSNQILGHIAPWKLKQFLCSGNGLLSSKQRRLHSLPHRWCVPCIAWKLALYCVEYLMHCGLPQESLTVLEEPQNLRVRKKPRDLSFAFLQESWNLPSISLIKRLFMYVSHILQPPSTFQLLLNRTNPASKRPGELAKPRAGFVPPPSVWDPIFHLQHFS